MKHVPFLQDCSQCRTLFGQIMKQIPPLQFWKHFLAVAGHVMLHEPPSHACLHFSPLQSIVHLLRKHIWVHLFELHTISLQPLVMHFCLHSLGVVQFIVQPARMHFWSQIFLAALQWMSRLPKIKCWRQDLSLWEVHFVTVLEVLMRTGRKTKSRPTVFISLWKRTKRQFGSQMGEREIWYF